MKRVLVFTILVMVTGGVLVLPGCRSASRSVITEDAAVPAGLPLPVEVLYQRSAAIETLNGRLKLKVKVEERLLSGIAVFAVKYSPLAVRTDAYSILGLKAFAVAADDDTFTMVDYLRRSYVTTAIDDLPLNYKGWYDLWQLFPLPRQEVLAEAEWNQVGDTWIGTWASTPQHVYELQVPVSDTGICGVNFIFQDEKVGELWLARPQGELQLPHHFTLISEGLEVVGEMRNLTVNGEVVHTPLIIPSSFQPL